MAHVQAGRRALVRSTTGVCLAALLSIVIPR